MTLEDSRPHGGQVIRQGRFLEVGTADCVTEVQQDLGNAAHADAADPHEVDAAVFNDGFLKKHSVSTPISALRLKPVRDFPRRAGRRQPARGPLEPA